MGRAAGSVIERDRYAALYGPTTGDRIRLADTALTVEVTEDLCRPRGAAGDEIVPGGGGVVRESMGQAVATRAEGAPDTVVTGAVILDHWGVVKADVGIRDGRVCGIGKAGNPDTMDGVHPSLVIGPSTGIVVGNGRILTAGAVDCHARLVTAAQLPEALAAGVTTVVGGGTGPAEGSRADGITPGSWHLARMLESLDAWPLNVALLGTGATVSDEAMWEQLRAGAAGLKVHEDRGATPAAVDAALGVADEARVQVVLHGDPRGETGFAEALFEAIGGRTLHAHHTPCEVGGPGPAGRANVLPSSSAPTRPHTVNTFAELVACEPRAQSWVVPSALAAEDVLHDVGAVSMIGSDGQGMGRIGETVTRTWQTAHVNRMRRGSLPGDGAADNLRVRRYVAKYTICPAVAHGLDDEVGSVAVGKLADLVLWEPAFFGVRPHLVIKGGAVAYAATGDAHAPLPRRTFGASAAAATSVHFVAPAALEDGLDGRLAVRRRLVPVADVRGRGKASMPLNDALPHIEIDRATSVVRIDGDAVEAAPAGTLPMAQRYFMF